jgi:hypothetical protein
MDDAAVNEFFREYVDGFMWGDIEATIKARANYVAALALLNYTEVLGGLANGKLGLRNVARECFGDGLSLMEWKGDANYYKNFKVVLTDGASAPRDAEPWEVFRCGLAHEYFAKGIAGIDNNDTYADPRACDPDNAGYMWRALEAGGPPYLRFFTNAYYRDLRAGSDALHTRVMPQGQPRTNFETAVARISARGLSRKP